jgi:hypothetical protein
MDSIPTFEIKIIKSRIGPPPVYKFWKWSWFRLNPKRYRRLKGKWKCELKSDLMYDEVDGICWLDDFE